METVRHTFAIRQRRSRIPLQWLHEYEEWATIAVRVWIKSWQHHDAPRQFWTCSKWSWPFPTYADHPRFVQSHSDSTTNVLRMYHSLSPFLKSLTIGTKDRDSVTEALESLRSHASDWESNQIDDLLITSPMPNPLHRHNTIYNGS